MAGVMSDRVKEIGGRPGLGARLLHKAASFFSQVLSLTSVQGWPVEQSDSGENVNAETMLSLSAAWACVNLWCGTVSTLECEVYRASPGGGPPAKVPDHWLQQLLNSPNLDQTDVDFWEFMQASLEMRGNAYAEKRRIAGRIVTLYPIRPETVQVRRNPQSGRLLYRYTDADGRFREVDQEEIWHIRGPGGSPLGGLSTLAFGRNAFGHARALDRASGATFRNGVRPSGVLKFKEWLKPDKREAAAAKLDAAHTTAMNAGKPLILEGGVEWQQISFSPVDAQMIEQKGFSVEDICRWFQMPPILIGHSEKVSAWGTGIKEILQGFVKFGLRRRLKRIEKSAAQQLLTAQERGEGYYIKFNMEGLLRGDPDARATFYGNLAKIGAMTINEIRRLEELPPLDGGDVPMIQAQYEPLGAALQPKPLGAPPKPVLLPPPSPKAADLNITLAVAERNAPPPPAIQVDARVLDSPPRRILKRVTERDAEGNIVAWEEISE